MQEKQYFVYILAKGRNSTFYTGLTADLVNRISQHKKKCADGFTKKHNIDKLVYFEIHNNYETALQREKQLKKWHRTWKMRLIEEMNRDWKDLYQEICPQEETGQTPAFAGVAETLND